MESTQGEIQRLIEYLKGTETSIDIACNELCIEGPLTSGEHAMIEEQIFRCVKCKEWKNQSDHDYDGVCIDCDGNDIHVEEMPDDNEWPEDREDEEDNDDE